MAGAAPSFCHTRGALLRSDKTRMRIALAQLNPTSGDIEGNTARILAALEAAAARGADLVVTPEMALPGYCIGDLVEDAGFLAANERAMQRDRRARRAALPRSSASSTSTPRARNESGRSGSTTPRRSSATARVLQRAHKTLLPSYRYFDDKRFFTPADRREPVAVPPAAGRSRLGVSICEDLWDEFYDIKPLAELAGKGAGLLLNINASPFCPGKRHERDAAHPRAHRAARQAARLRQHHRRRGQRQEHHPVRRRKPCLRRRTAGSSRSAASSRRICSSSTSDGQTVGRRRCALPPIDRDREMYDALVMALRDYMRKTGLHARDRRGVRRDRLGAGAGDCGRRARRRPGLGLQHAVAVQHRDDPVDCRAAGGGARRRATASSRSRRSTSTSARSSSSTPIRSRRASPAKTFTPASAGC